MPTVTTQDIDRLAGTEGERLFAALGEHDPARMLAVAERARRAGFEPAMVAAAMTQLRLRERAATDLGTQAASMFFTDAGLQQATRWQVARLHAQRFAAAGVQHVADLGCGLGVDSLALAEAGLAVTAFDLDATTAAAARANLAHHPTAEVRMGDVMQLFADRLPDGVTAASAAWLDPARRTASGRRVFDPRQAVPPLSFIVEVATRLAATGAKLAPGVDHALLPDAAETQWISVDGDLVEATLWFGAARQEQRRSALVLRSGGDATLVVADDAPQPEVAPVSEFLLEPDPAIIRAGALGVVAAAASATLLDPTIAYLSSPAPVGAPTVRCYRVRDVIPFSLKGLRSYLRERDVGVVTIKKRGTAVEPEQLRRQLKLRGTTEATVVLTRVAGRQSVLIVDPVGR